MVTLMMMIEDELKKDGMSKKILTVWFDAWKYEREEYVAVIPFLRVIRLGLEGFTPSNDRNRPKWDGLKKGLERAYTAGPIETDLAELVKSYKGNGSIGNDVNTVYYDATKFIEQALKNLREDDPEIRIVVFVDDLDRCIPEKALEVLESIKSFLDIEGTKTLDTHRLALYQIINENWQIENMELCPSLI
jgi:hypothetical protein